MEFATADAERLTENGLVLASAITLSVPVMLPAADGVITTLNCVDCPAPSDNGVASPVTANWGFDTWTPVTFSVVVPVFATVTDCVDCFPTVILPKLTLVGLSCRAPAPVEPFAAIRPVQPLSITRAGSSRANTKP